MNYKEGDDMNEIKVTTNKPTEQQKDNIITKIEEFLEEQYSK